MRHDKPATPVASSRPEQGRGSSHAAGVAIRYCDDPRSAFAREGAAFYARYAQRLLGSSLWFWLRGQRENQELCEAESSRFYALALYYRGEVGYVDD